MASIQLVWCQPLQPDCTWVQPLESVICLSQPITCKQVMWCTADVFFLCFREEGYKVVVLRQLWCGICLYVYLVLVCLCTRLYKQLWTGTIVCLDFGIDLDHNMDPQMFKGWNKWWCSVNFIHYVSALVSADICGVSALLVILLLSLLDVTLVAEHYSTI